LAVGVYASNLIGAPGKLLCGRRFGFVLRLNEKITSAGWINCDKFSKVLILERGLQLGTINSLAKLNQSV